MDRLVRWNSVSDVSTLFAQAVRLRIDLKDGGLDS